MNIQKIIEKNKSAIVLIDVQIPGEGNQKKISIRGTGFVVSNDGKFITNAHVYKQIPQSELQYAGVSVPGVIDTIRGTHYDRYEIELLRIDEENDVALLKIKNGKNFQPIQSIGNSEKVQEGDNIIYIGYPLATEMLTMGFGITMTTNKCIISSIKKRGSDGSLHFFLIDTHVNNGSSGSPLFNEKGEVVGVISAKISSKIPMPDGKIADIPANIGICRPAKYISKILENIK